MRVPYSFLTRPEGCVLGDDSESLGYTATFTVFAVPVMLLQNRYSKACLSPWTGCDKGRSERDTESQGKWRLYLWNGGEPFGAVFDVPAAFEF